MSAFGRDGESGNSDGTAGQQRIGQPSAWGGVREGWADAEQPNFRGSWSSQPNVSFAAGDDNPVYGPGGQVARYVYAAPTLDLRGDLKDISGYGTNATRIDAEALLFAQYTLCVSIKAALAQSGSWKFYYVTRSHASNPTFMQFDNTRVDISTQVYGGSVSTAGAVDTYTSLLTFDLIRPARYWSFYLVADCFWGTVGASNLTASAGLY